MTNDAFLSVFNDDCELVLRVRLKNTDDRMLPALQVIAEFTVAQQLSFLGNLGLHGIDMISGSDCEYTLVRGQVIVDKSEESLAVPFDIDPFPEEGE